jgi:hypothetical protein
LVLAGRQLPLLLLRLRLLQLCSALCLDPFAWQQGFLLLCWVVPPWQLCQSCWPVERRRLCWVLLLALQELLLQPALAAAAAAVAASASAMLACMVCKGAAHRTQPLMCELACRITEES